MSLVDKNKINDALILLESESKKSNQMKDKLRDKLLLESEEENLELDALAQEAETEEEGLEEIIPGEEIESEEEEQSEYIDITGGVEEKDGVFTVQIAPEVTLTPGNKIKFLVGDEEFKGTVGEPTEEEGVLTITIDEEEPEVEEELLDTEEEIPAEEEETSEEITDEEILDEETENIIEEVLLEAELGDDAASLDTTDDLESIDNIGTETEEPLDTTDDLESIDDAGAGSEISMGGGSELSNEVNDEIPAEEIPSEETELSQIVDTDELVNELLGTEEINPLDAELTNHLNEEILDEEIENIVNKVLAENTVKENPNYKKATNEEKPATKLGDEEISGKVKGAEEKQTVPGVKSFKVNPVAKQADVQSKKLKTEEPKGTVAQTKASKEKPAEITSKVKQGGEAHVDPKDEYTSKLKQDSATKSKALVKLAEDLVRVQDEVKKLRLENYKLLKVNGLLTLLPELEQSTRETLCEKFDRCKTDVEVTALYKKVSSIVKESRKPSLNQLVTNKQSGVQYFKENKEHDIKSLKETVDKTQNEEISVDQRRKNHLMGLDKEEGYYKNL